MPPRSAAIERKELKLATISMPGNTKISTLQERFLEQFGLMLRVYSGRNLADVNETLSAVRKKIGEPSIEVQANIKVGNLEKKFIEEYGIKVRVAGSNNSYLCEKGITLAQALKLDKEKTASALAKLEVKRGGKLVSAPTENKKTIKIRATVELFSVAEQPDSEDLIPETILEAKKIWEDNAYKSTARVLELVNPYISCNFIADNIDDWRWLLRDDNEGEFVADEIIVTDVDFSNSPLPAVSLECIFTLPLADTVSVGDIESELEDDCWSWRDCIIPCWELAEEVGLEELDLTIGEHNGVEITVNAE